MLGYQLIPYSGSVSQSGADFLPCSSLNTFTTSLDKNNDTPMSNAEDDIPAFGTGIGLEHTRSALSMRRHRLRKGAALRDSKVLLSRVMKHWRMQWRKQLKREREKRKLREACREIDTDMYEKMGSHRGQNADDNTSEDTPMPDVPSWCDSKDIEMTMERGVHTTLPVWDAYQV